MAFVPKVTSVPTLQVFMDTLLDFAVLHGGFSQHAVTADFIRILKKDNIFYSFRVSSYYQAGTIRVIEGRLSTVAPTNAATYLTSLGCRSASQMATWFSNGPFVSYYLFQTEGAVHGVLEVFPGVFTHISLGKIRTVGGFLGGHYISANNTAYKYAVGTTYPFYFYSGYNSPIFDGGMSAWTAVATYPSNHPTWMYNPVGATLEVDNYAPASSSPVGNQRARMVVGAGMYDTLITRFGVAQHNNRAPILPIYVRLYDPVSTSDRFVGEVPGAGFLNGKYIEPGEIVDGDWQVFPCTARETSPNNQVYEGSPGRSIAYKRA